ncbi:MAG: thrombospondin type 3 repeat-containing protein [Phycisphaerales bacterium]|nr:thrombospondin type 3 repeat-containing protein [Phycisphaerales bacterium]MCB9855477.1 thrombospondin type 3 repeat-containing protein [Phycisphaerales bacterium]MCB9864254.1 thrombospondin type 3 repeat-containing protein [Phycisphaerales bacterium]
MSKKIDGLSRFATFCVAIALTTISSATADVVEIGTVSQETAEFSSGPGGSTSTVKVAVPAPLDDFVYDFSTLGDTTMTVTWQAPAGQYIEIDVPDNFDSINLQFYLQVHGAVSAGNRSLPLDVTASQLGCNPLPDLDGNTRMTITGPSGSGMRVLVYYRDLVPGETYRVTSLTAEATIPADFDVNINEYISSFYVRGYLFSNLETLDNPGQWVRLASIDQSGADVDTDGDGVNDICDVCPGFDDHIDTDADGIPDQCDNCPDTANADQADTDADGMGDVCDSCPNRRWGDVDGDGAISTNDVAPFASVLVAPENASSEDLCAADLNEDGSVDGLDIAILVRRLLVD